MTPFEWSYVVIALIAISAVLCAGALHNEARRHRRSARYWRDEANALRAQLYKVEQSRMEGSP